MGSCFECRVTIDGSPGERACMRTCTQGMSITTDGAPA
jgi:sarcosine oxidase subunit alpha